MTIQAYTYFKSDLNTLYLGESNISCQNLAKELVGRNIWSWEYLLVV